MSNCLKSEDNTTDIFITAGLYIGIICTETGSPGTWRNFRHIQ